MFSVISSQSAIIFWNSSNDMLRDARGEARVSTGSRTAPIHPPSEAQSWRGTGYSGRRLAPALVRFRILSQNSLDLSARGWPVWGEARAAEGPPGPPIEPAESRKGASLPAHRLVSFLPFQEPRAARWSRSCRSYPNRWRRRPCGAPPRPTGASRRPLALPTRRDAAMTARAVRERSDTRRPGTEKRPRVLIRALRSPRSRDFRRCRVVFLSRSSVFFFAASTMLSFAPVIAAICAERRMRTRGCEARYGRGVLAVWRTHEVHLRLRRLLLLLVLRWGHAALRLRHWRRERGREAAAALMRTNSHRTCAVSATRTREQSRRHHTLRRECMHGSSHVISDGEQCTIV